MIDLRKLPVHERSSHSDEFVQQPCLDGLKLSKNLRESGGNDGTRSRVREQVRPSFLHRFVVLKATLFEHGA
ncbi:MAG: hypothetical protein QOD71_3502 [Thermoleophilaceae bacterium]|nr:hypothetical protein [Thermoleophilaceae bacterium]